MDLFLRNRTFLCRIRAGAYERAYDRFREVETLFDTKAAPSREMLKMLDGVVFELEAAFEYASDAVRGLKRRRVRRYRHDAQHGVLEEEIVLQHFLEEMATLARFLRKRVETDLKLRLYQERLRRLQSQSSEANGFLQGILDSMGGMVQEESSDLGRILELMKRRYKVGDRLMAVLKGKTVL